MPSLMPPWREMFVSALEMLGLLSKIHHRVSSSLNVRKADANVPRSCSLMSTKSETVCLISSFPLGSWLIWLALMTAKSFDFNDSSGSQSSFSTLQSPMLTQGQFLTSTSTTKSFESGTRSLITKTESRFDVTVEPELENNGFR